MAQTELMLRLLKDGKIVGYSKFVYAAWIGYRGLRFVSLSASEYPEWFRAQLEPPQHNSFELGIRNNDIWFFDGDILDYGDGVPRTLHLGIDCLGQLDYAKRLGNIHDNPELLKEKP